MSAILRFTLLAPEFVETILDGRQSAELQLDDLLHGFPLGWEERSTSVASKAEDKGRSGPGTPMIDLYTWTTPNGRKVSILLEELAVPYEVHAVDLATRAQFSPGFTRISPSNRIPAIVDREANFALMESGAIMMYLAEKHGHFVLKGPERWRMIEWLMWQMGGLGPMLGQVHHFLKHNPGRAPYAEQRYSKEAHRLYDTLNRRLDGRDYVAGAGRGEYSIADMAIWPWVSRFEWQQVDLAVYPAVRSWYLRLAERPAVQRGYHVPKYVNEVPMP